MQLIRERLWPIVCRRKLRPTAGSSGQSEEGLTRAQHEFDDEAERATATIFLYLDDTAERLVRDIRDPVELWKRLKDMYSSTGFCTRFTLWRKLFKSHLREHASMYDYVDSIQSTRRQLRDAGFDIPDEIMAAVLLKGLPGCYNDFIASVTEAYELSEAIKYDRLVVQLVEASKRQEDEKKSDAVVATGGKRSTTAAGPRDTALRCNNCGKQGHKAKVCPAKSREKENGLLGGDVNSDPTISSVVW